METILGARSKRKKAAIVIGIAIVATVILAAAASVILSRPQESHRHSGPGPSMMRSVIPGGDKFTFSTLSKKTAWSDISILLTDGTNTVMWKPVTSDLAGGGSTTKANGTKALGTLTIYCNTTDLAGNGNINLGDYFTLTVGGGVFSSSAQYTVTIMHNPSSAEICHADFQD